MRLNPFNPGSVRVRDHGRGSGGRMGGGGKIGCGTLVIAAIAALVFGVDPAAMLGSAEQMGPAASPGQNNQPAGSVAESCAAYDYGTETCNTVSSLNQTWEPVFNAAGVPFEEPYLDFYQQSVTSGCGPAQSAMGPFYCPADHGIYIDTSFYTQMSQQMGAGGDFARMYVIAHEYGHHIQTLTGVSDAIRSAQSQNPRAANQLQVRMELQADCYAGVWAGKNRNLIERGDFEEGMRAASSIGDDTVMRNAGQRVNPEGFTHGSSEQRMQALRLGMESADDTQCDRITQFN